MRKLRVLTKEYKLEKARKKTENMMVRKSSGYDTLVIKNKLERIEGNDIVKLLQYELVEERTPPLKEVHVTGRIAKKILASDYANMHGIRGITVDGYIDTVKGVPIVRNNLSFRKLLVGSNAQFYRRNPTGREEWLMEIKFIGE